MIQAPVLVRRANTVEEADVIAAWLEDAGVKAAVVGRDSVGVQAFGVTDDEGVAVYVADEEAAILAAELLAEHDQSRSKAARVEAASFLNVVCEECRTVNTFGASSRGTVQECRACGANLDVPAGDEA